MYRPAASTSCSMAMFLPLFTAWSLAVVAKILRGANAVERKYCQTCSPRGNAVSDSVTKNALHLSLVASHVALINHFRSSQLW